MSKTPKFDPLQLTDAMRASAQQIWLAGLGAFSKAQHEGGKVFENLVNDGMSMQRQSQSAAQEKWNEATKRVTDMAEQVSLKTTGSIDRLESIFEDRVIKALTRQGYPTPQEWQALLVRLEQLEASLKPKQSKVRAMPRQPASQPAGRKSQKT